MPEVIHALAQGYAIRSLALVGCINAAYCIRQPPKNSHISSLLISLLVAYTLEVKLPGTAQGSNVQTSDLDGGERGLDRSFGLGVSIFLERLGNSINKGFGVVVLPDGADHLEKCPH